LEAAGGQAGFVSCPVSLTAAFSSSASAVGASFGPCCCRQLAALCGSFVELANPLAVVAAAAVFFCLAAETWSPAKSNTFLKSQCLQQLQWMPGHVVGIGIQVMSTELDNSVQQQAPAHLPRNFNDSDGLEGAGTKHAEQAPAHSNSARTEKAIGAPVFWAKIRCWSGRVGSDLLQPWSTAVLSFQQQAVNSGQTAVNSCQQWSTAVNSFHLER